MPLTDQDYGSRDYGAKDPDDNTWFFGTYRPPAPGGELMARFNMVDLAASDVLATIEFYRRVGVEIPDETVWKESGDRAARRGRSSPTVSILGINSRELTARYDTNAGHRVILSSTVDTRDDVDSKYAELTSAGSHRTPRAVRCLLGRPVRCRRRSGRQPRRHHEPVRSTVAG